MEEYNNPEILSDAEVSSFNSSSLNEILNRSSISLSDWSIMLVESTYTSKIRSDWVYELIV